MTLISSLKVTNDLEKWTKEKTAKAKHVVKKHAFIIQGGAASTAPVDTGALKNSIEALPEGDGSNWIVQDGVSYGIHQELGTSKMPGKHFLAGAAEKDADKFFDEIHQVLNE